MDVTIADIVASLRERGFVPEADAAVFNLTDVETQFFAVAEELGEVSRLLRRLRQRHETLDVHHLGIEAADVVIAAVNLLYRTCGPRAEAVVAEKMAQDERRGWLHSGLSRAEYEARPPRTD